MEPVPGEVKWMTAGQYRRRQKRRALRVYLNARSSRTSRKDGSGARTPIGDLTGVTVATWTHQHPAATLDSSH